MKKLLTTILGVFALAAALPALAGPDWQLIEKARAEKQAAALETGRVSSSGTSAARGDCRVERLVLPLDHGPRAQTTPYQNAQRKARHDAQVKACPMASK